MRKRHWEAPIRPEVREQMQQLAELISKVTPPGIGFTLFMFDQNAETKEGHISYISSAQRGDMIRVLKEWIAAQEGRN